MTDRELMQQALDALLRVWHSERNIKHSEAIDAIRARLAQPEPDDGYCQACDGDSCTAKEGCVARDNPPPQREWKGLTDEEITACIQMGKSGYLDGFVKPLATSRAVEAKLKEKNGF